MFAVCGAILALTSFLLGFAWGRRIPDPEPSPTLYTAGDWAVSGYDGAYLLIENHCPICAAAAACQGFCRAELSLFEMLLAPARVERLEHILAGARRCAYRVVG